MYWPALGQWTRPVFAPTRRNPAAVMRAVATSSVVNLSDVYAGVDEQQASLLSLCVDLDVLLQRLRSYVTILPSLPT